MNKMHHIEVNVNDLIGERLDKFIRYNIAGIKQSHLEKIIGSGGIRVNKKNIYVEIHGTLDESFN